MRKKNPTPVWSGIKDSIIAMDQGGSNIVSEGTLKQQLQCRFSPSCCLLSAVMGCEQNVAGIMEAAASRDGSALAGFIPAVQEPLSGNVYS